MHVRSLFCITIYYWKSLMMVKVQSSNHYGFVKHVLSVLWRFPAFSKYIDRYMTRLLDPNQTIFLYLEFFFRIFIILGVSWGYQMLTSYSMLLSKFFVYSENIRWLFIAFRLFAIQAGKNKCSFSWIPPRLSSIHGYLAGTIIKSTAVHITLWQTIKSIA